MVLSPSLPSIHGDRFSSTLEIPSQDASNFSPNTIFSQSGINGASTKVLTLGWVGTHGPRAQGKHINLNVLLGGRPTICDSVSSSVNWA